MNCYSACLLTFVKLQIKHRIFKVKKLSYRYRYPVIMRILRILLFLFLSSTISALLQIKRGNLLVPKITQQTYFNAPIPGIIMPSTSIHHSTGKYRRTTSMMSLTGNSGSTKLDRKTDQKTISKPSFKEEIEKDWRLVLHDDNVHTIQQVCDIVSKHCPLCPGPRAYEVTLEVHMTGAGTVAVANKKLITDYTKRLQAAGLTVSMAPDDEFETSINNDYIQEDS